MNIAKKGSSPKQNAYARRSWGAEGKTKKEIALDVGYSPTSANSVVSKIESKPGYLNAIAQLAADSNQLALSVMYEIKARGFEDYTNRELVTSLSAIAGAWEKFNRGLREKENPDDKKGNRLRTIVLQNIKTQTNITSAETTAPPEKVIETTAVEDPGF